MPRTVPTSPRPVDGSQPSQTEKIMISIVPSQKFGRLKPRIDHHVGLVEHRVGPQPRPQAERNADSERQERCDEGQFQGRRHALRIRSIEG